MERPEHHLGFWERPPTNPFGFINRMNLWVGKPQSSSTGKGNVPKEGLGLVLNTAFCIRPTRISLEDPVFLFLNKLVPANVDPRETAIRLHSNGIKVFSSLLVQN